MTRKTLLPLLVLLALANLTLARTRAVSSSSGHLDAKVDGATVSGIVTSVSGSTIRIADDLVAIDASGAKIVVERGKEATVSEIEKGMLVFVVLKTGDVAANAPLPAAMITATRLPEALLFGPVQSVDLGASTLTLLGRTIQVTSETSFGGVSRLNEVLPNQIVQVQAEATNGKLVADSVLLISRIPTNTHLAHGTVKSIGADSWVIAREKESDLTVAVNAQTKIAGSPKVGDSVEVVYTINSASEAVAISIIKFERPKDPQIPTVTTLHGTVKKIAQTEWTITLSGANDQAVAVNERTKILPGIAVGDRVDVLAEKRSDGTLLALAIVKLP